MEKLVHLGSDFTTSALSVVDQLEGRAASRSLNLGGFLPELVIWTILRWERTVASSALGLSGVDCRRLEESLDSLLGDGSRSLQIVSRPIDVVRDWARRQASLLGNGYVGTEHLLLGAVEAAGPDLSSLLAAHHVDYFRIKLAIVDLLSGIRSSP